MSNGGPKGSRGYVPGPQSNMTFSSPFSSAFRRQQSYSSPCSQADSGYSSSPATPLPQKYMPPTRIYDGDYSTDSLWMFGDGYRSEDDPFVDRDPRRVGVDLADEAQAKTQSQKKKLQGNFTLPARSPRSAHSRPAIPFRSDSEPQPPRAAAYDVNTTRSRSSSLRGLDRFIPNRQDSSDTVQTYKTGKAPHELTKTEKILRHGDGTEDAFRLRRRNVSHDLRGQSLSDSLGPSSARVRNILSPLDQNNERNPARQVSHGNVWGVGGVVPSAAAINNGRGQLLRSGTNARLFRTTFPNNKPRIEDDLENHEARLAMALGMDRAKRVLETNMPHRRGENGTPTKSSTQWNGVEWVQENESKASPKPTETRDLPIPPFKVLDAPNLRDDFYCSILAYSVTSRTLAVGLGNLLYGWAESRGVRLLNGSTELGVHLTSVAFSSTNGAKSILAFGRNDRTFGLMSLLDDPDNEISSHPLPRFEVVQRHPITCVSWKPTCTYKTSRSPMNPRSLVKTEDLLVGDEHGYIHYYSVEWPDRWEVERYNWAGSVTLLSRIVVHTQQICGLSWSPDGELFASGGNDNTCCLFETRKVTGRGQQTRPEGLIHAGSESDQQTTTTDGGTILTLTDADTEPQVPQSPNPDVVYYTHGCEKYRWGHRAAVKAIAFCPWQDGLVATGGGSNDKCIHFFHTTSGAPLATISVSAQVTSLIWSTTKREIAATFGYAQPEHPVRIAVFSWPDCRQVAAIPWASEHRALYAIPCPRGPGDARLSRLGETPRGPIHSKMEGCIMVASSDKSVKFHEIWTPEKRATAGGVGMLRGSDILESLEGIDRDGDVIR
ncbi:hypothetical protein OQA88_2015 [Cercophora sp. LCS_1]